MSYRLCIFVLFFLLSPAALTQSDQTNPETADLDELSFHTNHPFPICDFEMDHSKPRGLLNGRMPKEDKKGISSTDFFDELQSLILKTLKDEADYTRRVIECYKISKPTRSNDPCSFAYEFQFTGIDANGEKKTVGTPLNELVRIARESLAAGSDGQLLRHQVAKVNPSLRSSNIFKLTPWKPLTPDEEKEAQNILSREYKRIEKQRLKQRNPFSMSTTEELLAWRSEMLVIYRDILDQNPILQFLSSANPNQQELVTAARQLLKTTKAEIERIESLKKHWHKKPYVGNIFRGVREPIQSPSFDVESLGLFDYGTITEQLLASKPEYCSVVADMFDAKNKRDRNRMVGTIAATIGIGVSTAGLGLGPAILGGIGVTSGLVGSEIYEVYQADRLNRKSAFVVVKDSKEITRANQSSIDRNRSDLKTRIRRAPLEALIGGVANTGVRTLGKFANTGVRKLGNRGSKLYHVLKAN